MELSSAWLVACLVVPPLTGCVTVRTETPMAPPVTYTCCETADIDRLYAPGQMFTLHWIVEESGEQSTAPPRPVDLEAELTGPFATVEALKAAMESSAGPPDRPPSRPRRSAPPASPAIAPSAPSRSPPTPGQASTTWSPR